MSAVHVKTANDACPFLKFPGEGCYCLEIERTNIERVMCFCADDYLACTVFREMLAHRNDLKELVKNRKKSRELDQDQKHFTADHS